MNHSVFEKITAHTCESTSKESLEESQKQRVATALMQATRSGSQRNACLSSRSQMGAQRMSRQQRAETDFTISTWGGQRT